MEISCIALAGGSSTRFGRNKLFEVIDGKTLFARVISKLSLFESEIIIVTSERTNIPQDTAYTKAKIVKDIFPGKGSLGGIFTGLKTSKTLYNIIVACDMPFLNFNLLKYFVSLADGFDLVASVENNKFEPLHAVYSQNCISPIENIIQNKNNARIIEILPRVKVREISQVEIDKIDPYHLSFINVNTEEDLKIAREIGDKNK